MGAPFNVLAGTACAPAPTARMRTVSTIAAVAVIHAVLIGSLMRASERTSLPYAIQSPVIRAQLLSSAPAQAAPSALQSSAPAPQPVAKKKVEPRVRPAHVTPAPAPARSLVSAAPSQPAPPAPAATSSNTRESADVAAAAKANDDAGRPSRSTSPADGRETLAISAPKNVRHIDCRIVKPDYPALSRRRGEAGTAEVKFVISLTGAIESIELAKSSGYPRLDDAALAAMRTSSCRPYTENGAPVRAAYTQPFAFAFDD